MTERATSPTVRGQASRTPLRPWRVLPILGLLLALVGCGSPPASVATNRPARTSSSTPSPATPRYRWSRLSLANLVPGAGPASTLSAVLAPHEAGSDWLIVGTQSSTPAPSSSAGTTQTGSETSQATVWTSPNAMVWTKSVLGPPGTDSQARAVAAWGHESVIVGSIGTGSHERAAVWISKGPQEPFVAVPASPGLLGEPVDAKGKVIKGSSPKPSMMTTVAAGALGVFAAGTINGQTSVWYSTDGRRWTSLTKADDLINQATDAHINTLIVASSGVFAGGSVFSNMATDGALWHSTNGLTWERVESATQAFSGDGNKVITGLEGLGRGFVAVGGVESNDTWNPASWISPDGLSWSSASQAFPLAASSSHMGTGTIIDGLTGPFSGTAVVSPSHPLVAAGTSEGVQQLWTSTNGLSWKPLPLPGNAASALDWNVGPLALRGSTIVVANTTVGDPHVLVDRASHWTEVTATSSTFGTPMTQAVPTRLITDGPRLLLSVNLTEPGRRLGANQISALVLSSTNGVDWRVLNQPKQFNGHRVEDMLPLANGLLAVGGESATSASARGAPAATVWMSPDGGQSWQADTQDPSPFGGGNEAGARGVALTRLRNDYLAIGQLAAGASWPASQSFPVSPGKQPATSTQTAGAAGSGGVAPRGTRARRNSKSPFTIGPGGQAVGWISQDGKNWDPVGSLDHSSGLANEDPLGACGGPGKAVAVGTGEQAGTGTQALAWVTSDGRHWHAATITPAAAQGAQQAMDGCITTGNGFIAYGDVTGSNGTPIPALWQSNDGNSWDAQNVTAFATGDGAIAGLALRGTTWLAVTGTPSTQIPSLASAGLTNARSVGDSDAVGIWRSSDAGSVWAPLDTRGAIWRGEFEAQADQIDFAGARPVIAGSVDGQLTLWVGRLVRAKASSTSSH